MTGQYQYGVSVSHGGGPPVLVPPPGEQPWTDETLVDWLAGARHPQGTRIVISRRERGAKGPWPGTTAPYLDWRTYQVDAEGRAVQQRGLAPGGAAGAPSLPMAATRDRGKWASPTQAQRKRPRQGFTLSVEEDALLDALAGDGSRSGVLGRLIREEAARKGLTTPPPTPPKKKGGEP